MKKNKKIILLFMVFICSILFPLISYCEELDFEEPKYSEKYERWMELTDEEREELIEPSAYSGNSSNQKIQSKTSWFKRLFTTAKSQDSEFGESVPSNITQFITAEYGDVKNQGNTSACWAFSSATCFTSNYYLLNNELKNFSSFYIDFITSSDYNPYGNGFSRNFNDGGNMYQSLAIAMNGYGIALSSDMDEYNLEDSTYIYNNLINTTPDKESVKNNLKNIETDYYVSDYIEISGEEQIKRFIYNYGPILSYTNATETQYFYVESSNNIAYCCDDSTANCDHAITLVGWDDNYTNSKASGKKGAYIVLNSWGEEFGNNGLYYIFYDDIFMNEALIGATEVKDKDFDNIFQYDDCGCVYCIGIKQPSSVYTANVFENNKEKAQELKMVSAYFTSSGTYSIYVYDEGLPSDIELPSTTGNVKKVISYTVDTPGYHQIELDEPVLLENDKFTIIVGKYTTSIPVEYSISGIFCECATSNSGESFCSFDGKSFIDMYSGLSSVSSSFKKINNCIKAYTDDYEPPTYTVTFDSDGGSEVTSQTIVENEKATRPTNPTKNGYAFRGWFIGNVEYDFDTPVTQNITLNAKWSEDIIEIKENLDNAQKILIDDDNIYVRLNGNSSGIVTVSDFIENINFVEDWESIIVEKFGEESITYNKTSTLNDENASLENALKITICTNNNEFEYNYFQIGNIYLNLNAENGAINVNDISSLRKSIINSSEFENDTNFMIENSDINFSNDELGKSGDIGDVMSLRYKILYKTWIFSETDLNRVKQ